MSGPFQAADCLLDGIIRVFCRCPKDWDGLFERGAGPLLLLGCHCLLVGFQLLLCYCCLLLGLVVGVSEGV